MQDAITEDHIRHLSKHLSEVIGIKFLYGPCMLSTKEVRISNLVYCDTLETYSDCLSA